MFSKFSRIITVMVVLSLFGFSICAQAQDQAKPIYKNGFYFGGQINYLSLSGDDFNGSTFLYTTDEIMYIPKPDPGIGFGGLVGFREGKLGLEFSFITSSADGTIDVHGPAWSLDPYGSGHDVTLNIFSLYFKYWLIDTSSIQPYLLVGVDINTFSALNSAIANAVYLYGDTELTGMNIDLGAGISYYITPKVALNAGANLHIASFTTARGCMGYDYDLDEAVTGSLLNIYGCVIFVL